MSRHKFKPVEEWFIQADYDLATAKAMFKTARYIYTIFMCHLSIEKALKGLYARKFKKHSPTQIEKTLPRLLQQRGIDTEKIVIFGSYAKGNQKPDGDIDIMVISSDFRDRDIFEKVELTNGIHRQLVKMTKKAVDIMYYSDLEWKRGHSLIITAAKEDGIAIYERT